MHGFRPFALAVACVAVLPAVAQAQAGFRAGFAFENGKRAYGQGFSLEGSYTLGGSKPLGVRFDVGVQTFNGATPVAELQCPPTGCQRSWSLTVVSSSASLVLTKDLGANRVYWVAGVGGYALNDEPTTGRYTRFGWNGGVGVLMGKHRVAEVRYHAVIDPLGTGGFVPITVGFRF